MSSVLHRVVRLVGGTLVGLSLLVIVFGIGGRSIHTPTPIELLGYQGPIWLVYVVALAVLATGVWVLRRLGHPTQRRMRGARDDHESKQG